MLRIPLVVLVALVLCAPAQAATTVARNGAFTLDARQTGGRICIALRHSGHLQGARCGRIPRSPQRALSVNPNFGYAYAAAVPRSVRVAEAESTKGLRRRHRTVAARGFAARFVLIPPSPKFVRFYGPSRRLLGIDPGPIGYIGVGDETPVVDGVTASDRAAARPYAGGSRPAAHAGVRQPGRRSQRQRHLRRLRRQRAGAAQRVRGAHAGGGRHRRPAPRVCASRSAAARRSRSGTRRAVGVRRRLLFGGKLPVGEAVRTAEALDGSARSSPGSPSGATLEQPCVDEADDGSRGRADPQRARRGGRCRVGGRDVAAGARSGRPPCASACRRSRLWIRRPAPVDFRPAALAAARARWSPGC